MKITRLFAAASALGLLGACAAPADPVANETSWRLENDGDLNSFFDCLQDLKITLVSAHRGGPMPGYPENGLETLQATLRDVPAIMEIDVAQSADGVLFLMHDDTLERTTNGEGEAKAKSWSELKELRLEDAAGAITDFTIPTFADVLSWAKTRTVLQVDFKRSAEYEKVIAEIKRQDAEDRVILIAYSPSAAKKLHALAPNMMISLSMRTQSDLNAATAAGLPADRLVAFTGIEEPAIRFYPTLETREIEAIFGTLGWRNSIDQQIEESGDASRYADIAEMGVDIIATDRPRAAHKALEDAGLAPTPDLCGIDKE